MGKSLKELRVGEDSGEVLLPVIQSVSCSRTARIEMEIKGLHTICPPMPGEANAPLGPVVSTVLAAQ